MPTLNAEIWPLIPSLVLFAAAAAAILLFGVRMTVAAERLAARTGLGEAVMGAVFVGASTSLAEIVTSTSAAWNGHAGLAVSNAIGSVAGQTAVLAVADMFYRRANLEHAAASAENLTLGAFGMVLLAVPLLAMGVPEPSVLGVHPATLGLLLGYVLGIRLVSRAHRLPMWHPRRTAETRPADRGGDETEPSSSTALWLRFALPAIVVAAAGWVLARSGVSIAAHTGLSETVVGALLTGLASSLPELVTAVTAVRIGALTLAVGDVLGGNAFDTVIVGFSDIAYREGSIFAQLSGAHLFLISLSILLTGVLLLGMLQRERHGIANIGWESFLVLVLYLGGAAVLVNYG